jgi:phosphohistidine phosphatase SixA
VKVLPNSLNWLWLIVLAMGLFGCAAGPSAGGSAGIASARNVFLVRHAERVWEGDDPLLTAEGVARAQALAAALSDAGVTAIIATQWRRTRDTAAPLADLLNLHPEIIPVYEGKARENIEAVAAAVRRHQDETVLVVGHITVTGVIAALGGPTLPTICENVFSDLFPYHPAARENGLLHLRYGAPEDVSRRCK